jgi:hypothetical protein
MLPNNLKNFIFFYTSFKKDPIITYQKPFRNCKSNYTYQKFKFENNLLFFNQHIPTSNVSKDNSNTKE